MNNIEQFIIILDEKSPFPCKRGKHVREFDDESNVTN